MGTIQQPKKPAVWQDIRPIKTAKPVDKISSQKNKKISRVKEIFRRFLKFFYKFKITNKTSAFYKKLANAKTFNLKNLIILSLMAVLIFLTVPSISNRQDDQSDNNTPATEVDKKTYLIEGTPDFDILTPNGIAISQLNGRVNPTNKSPVFVYTDKIGTITIRVSQMPLPEEFRYNTDKAIEDLATRDKATGKLSAANTTVYIKNSSKGPQSLIFHKDDLLIIITSDDKLTNGQWAEYIGSLK